MSTNNDNKVRRIAAITLSFTAMCSICFFLKQGQTSTSTLIVLPGNIRSMQLAVMARRAAATGSRASQGYLPTVQYQSTMPIQTAPQYSQYTPPQAVSPQYQYSGQKSSASQYSPEPQQEFLQGVAQKLAPAQSDSVGNELSDEAKGAHLALSGALSAFHGAALPQASVHVQKSSYQSVPSSQAMSSFHDKLFKIFTAPETDDSPSPVPKIRNSAASQPLDLRNSPNLVAGVPQSEKSALDSFHNRMFQLFTAPSPQSPPAAPPTMHQRTVDNVISVDPPRSAARAAAAKGRLAAFHDRMFQLFTAPSPNDSGPAQLQSDAAVLSRDAARLKSVHSAAARRSAGARSASLADKGFYSLWKGGSEPGRLAPAKPAAVDPVLHVAVDRYGIPIAAATTPEDAYGLPRDGAAAVPV